ncbi:uncharacterized protein JCM6883_005560 [Sporobolomyces salmoneus]|uniref:uncharacterized protein n=1 Tax=Sporobolomyces salmoneus TaxID=183962 RepID=UPI0031762D7C
MLTLRRSPRKQTRKSSHSIEIPVALLPALSIQSQSSSKAPSPSDLNLLKAPSIVHLTQKQPTANRTKGKGKSTRTGKRRSGEGGGDKVDSEVESMQRGERGEDAFDDDHHVDKAVHSVQSTSSSSSSTLPSLLGHLSLSNTAFPDLSTSASATTTNFTFESPLHSPSSQSSSKRDLSQSSASTRLKKRKVLHNFYRSPLILSGPSNSATPPLSSSAPSTSSSIATPRWWASVSRCDGESKQSRFAPNEEEWIEGEYDDSFSKTSRLQIPLDRSFTPTRPTSTLSRSESAPAILESTSTGEPPQLEGEEPVSGPALKKLLLLNLRQKWSKEGVPTSAGEAALRFKKWVLWNAWRLETQGPGSEYSGEYGGSEDEGDAEMMEWIDPDDEMDDSDNDFELTATDDSDEGMTMGVPHDFFNDSSRASAEEEEEESYAGGCVFSLTGQMIDLSLPTPPSSPTKSRSRPSSPISPPRQQYAPLSAATSNTQVSTTSPPTPSARPGLRRSETVPAILPSFSDNLKDNPIQTSTASNPPSSSPVAAPSTLGSPFLLCEG